MLETLLSELIKQLNSSVFVLLGLLALAFIFTAKISAKLAEWRAKFSHQDEKIDDLRNLSKEVVVMQTKIDMIYQHLNPHIPVRARSPLGLTETGEKIINKINAHGILKKYLDSLVKEVESYSPQTAYDIQMVSMRVAKENLINFLNEKELNAMKQEAYNNGILLEDVFSIFGVLLRDHILKEKGIPVTEVDNTKK